jgi:hypothetical protein
MVGSGVRDRADPDIVALKVLTNALAMALLSGLSTGVKQATRLIAVAISIVR